MNKLLKSFKYLPHTVLGILFALMLLEIKLAVEMAVKEAAQVVAREEKEEILMLVQTYTEPKVLNWEAATEEEVAGLRAQLSVLAAPTARLSSHGNRLCELWGWGHGQYA